MLDVLMVALGLIVFCYVPYLYLFAVERLILRAYRNVGAEKIPDISYHEYLEGCEEGFRRSVFIRVWAASVYPGWRVGRYLHNAIVSRR